MRVGKCATSLEKIVAYKLVRLALAKPALVLHYDHFSGAPLLSLGVQMV